VRCSCCHSALHAPHLAGLRWTSLRALQLLSLSPACPTLSWTSLDFTSCAAAAVTQPCMPHTQLDSAGLHCVRCSFARCAISMVDIRLLTHEPCLLLRRTLLHALSAAVRAPSRLAPAWLPCARQQLHDVDSRFRSLRPPSCQGRRILATAASASPCCSASRDT
jgi:hypothetical protein